MTNSTRSAAPCEDGQTMAEYAMVLSVITITILLGFVAIGDAAGELVATIASRIS